MADTNDLHLPDLVIKGFRGIEDLSIPRLGRVTLLAGKNSVGKTTVLDAIRVFAARGRFYALDEILKARGEILVDTNEDGEFFSQADWTSLFYGRNISQSAHISIGPTNAAAQLNIRTTYLTSAQSPRQTVFPFDTLVDDRMQALEIEFQEKTQIIPALLPPTSNRSKVTIKRILDDFRYSGVAQLNGADELAPQLEYQLIGPGLLSDRDLARYWDRVVLTDHETQAVRSLSLIFGTEVDRVAVVGVDPHTPSRISGPKAIAKLKGHDRPVPLRSLGDGALRLFSIALAIANSRDGFLLIDEAENGIHYTLQKDFWRMVLRGAQENNVQVIATTHSWDCIKGFAQAAMESKEVEGVLFRLSQQDGALRAVEYSEEELLTAAKQGIEVR